GSHHPELLPTILHQASPEMTIFDRSLNNFIIWVHGMETREYEQLQHPSRLPIKPIVTTLVTDMRGDGHGNTMGDGSRVEDTVRKNTRLIERLSTTLQPVYYFYRYLVIVIW